MAITYHVKPSLFVIVINLNKTIEPFFNITQILHTTMFICNYNNILVKRITYGDKCHNFKQHIT